MAFIDDLIKLLREVEREKDAAIADVAALREAAIDVHGDCNLCSGTRTLHDRCVVDALHPGAGYVVLSAEEVRDMLTAMESRDPDWVINKVRDLLRGKVGT